MTHKERLEKGLWYDANYDQEVLALRSRADELCLLFNQTLPSDTTKRSTLLPRLLLNMGEDVTILAPFYTEYGEHCQIGAHTFINHNAYLMDCAPITIGTFCFIGPNCGMYTAIHPIIAEERNLGLENVIAAGNPCHILRAITERDRLSPQDYPQESDCV